MAEAREAPSILGARGSSRAAVDDYEAANVILTRPVKGSTLKSWWMRLAARAGMRKAKVALARKLAVVLHRMLADGTNFVADKILQITGHQKFVGSVSFPSESYAPVLAVWLGSRGVALENLNDSVTASRSRRGQKRRV